ncbi:MAG: dihydroneopterin aldolase [Phycisphaerales bacterium]|nr:dihydroneopterin aldolase [Phycisphaerales bacterium]
MNTKYTMHLKDLVFQATHGYYEHEAKILKEFVVNLTIETSKIPDRKDHLDNLIDYEQVYIVLRERMLQHTPLIETLLLDLADTLLARFQLIRSLTLTIEKKDVFINHFQGQIILSITKERSNV